MFFPLQSTESDLSWESDDLLGNTQESLFHGVYAAVQGINRLAEPHTTCHSETEFEFVREIPE